MKFKVGQEVTIRRNFGERNGYDEFEYYYGGGIESVPLGTKGIVEKVEAEDKVFIRLKNWIWWVHPDELIMSEEQIKAEEERQERLEARFNSLLEGELLEDKQRDVGKRAKDGQRKFEPKFNAREEFALWVREEFPELKKYAKNGKDYKALIERKEEAMEGAKKAYDHAGETSRECVLDRFEYIFQDLKKSRIEDFAWRLEWFVRYIEHVSANLYDGGIRHYGTFITSNLGER